MIFRMVLYCLLSCFLYCCSDPRSEREKVRDHVLVQFSRQMQKKNLYAAGLGGGYSINNKINLMDVTFNYYEVMDIETARTLIVESTNELLDLINIDIKNKEFFEVFPTNVDTLSISIIGQMPESSRDYIRLVSVIKGRVYYCTDDPTRKIMPFIDVHEETFEEAKNILPRQT